jgi:hypothetical protein
MARKTLDELSRDAGMTIPAVSRKLHDLGLKVDMSSVRRMRKAMLRASVLAARFKAERSREKPEGAKTLAQLDLSQDCRFPIGDPSTENFWYCARAKAYSGLPYCLHHCRIAYVPSRPRK